MRTNRLGQKMLKRLVIGAFLVATLVLPTAGPANAESYRIRECVTEGTFTFSRPVTTEAKTFSIWSDYQAICVVEYSNGAIGTQKYPFQVDLGTWFGTCLSATGGDDAIGAMVGGTVWLSVSTTPTPMYGAYLAVLVPNQVCNMTSATFRQVSADVFPF